MKTIVIYYSCSGNTKKFAQEFAEKEGADLCEVKTLKPLNGFSALFVGCPKAFSGKGLPIHPLGTDMESYDKIVLMAPVWGGNPASPINSVIEILPSGKNVEMRMVSSGGTSGGKNKAIARVEAAGCTVTDYVDLKSPK